MVDMGNHNDLNFNQLFQLYLVFYLESELAFERAADNYYFLDDNDFIRRSPEEIVQLRESYDKAYNDLKYKALVFSAFVANFKDHIHFD